MEDFKVDENICFIILKAYSGFGMGNRSHGALSVSES